jgi:hypothetical protein
MLRFYSLAKFLASTGDDLAVFCIRNVIAASGPIHSLGGHEVALRGLRPL